MIYLLLNVGKEEVKPFVRQAQLMKIYRKSKTNTKITFS